MTTHCKPPPLLVVGASARAMAQSGRRAGIPVHAADIFNDADLVESCVSTTRIDRYPDGIVDAVRQFPPAEWCHVGGLENRPDILEAIAVERPLAGASPAAVRMVRDPSWLASRAAEVGLAMPATHDSPDGIPVDGSHLAKPLAAAGGRGIHRWTGGGVGGGPLVWQRFIEGAPCSAAYVAGEGRADMLFASRQLVGWTPSRGSEFAWCGGLTRRLPDSVEGAIERLGRHVATVSGLRGLFGIDFVVDDDGRVHPLEVNPRPTASMELWERMGAGSLAATHLAACGRDRPAPPPPASADSRVFGKAVLFAARAAIVTDGCLDRWMRWREDWRDGDASPALADIPKAATQIPRGGPVLTVFAAGADDDEVLDLLAQRLRAVEESLEPFAATVSRPSAEPGASPPPDRRIP